jgi:hypothetical protein
MARYRIELATIVELSANVDSMADAQKFALNFITKSAAAGAPRYKLHAIYDTERESPSDPSPIAGTEQVAA